MRGRRVVVAPLLPWLVSTSELTRLDDAHGLSVTPVHHLEVLVVAALAALVGAVVRAGTQEPRDVQGA